MESNSCLNSFWDESESSLVSSSSTSSDGGCGVASGFRYRSAAKAKGRPLSPSAISTPSAGSTTAKNHGLDSNPNTKPGTWNSNYAVAHLLDHLRTFSAPVSTPKPIAITSSSSTLSPGEAITTARTYPVSAHAWRSYPSLIFSSLSVSVFNGLLDEHVVELAWTSLDRQVSGRTVIIGGPEKRSGRNDGAAENEEKGGEEAKVKIELNAVALQGANRDEIVGTLLHHMIHAYLLVVCEGAGTCPRYGNTGCGGGNFEGERVGEGDGGNDDDRLAHGKAFAAILWEIRAQAAKHEADDDRPLPIGFGHRLPSAVCVDGRSHKSIRNSRSIKHANKSIASSEQSQKLSSSRCNGTDSTDFPSPNCRSLKSTHCPVSVPIITLDSASSWYTTECAPFLAAPTCMRRSNFYAYSSGGHLLPIPYNTMGLQASAYVTFIYAGDKPIGVLRTVIERFASLRLDVFADGRRWIELPRTGVEKGELSVLMAFLKGETYRPVLRSRKGAREGTGECEGIEGASYLKAPVIKTEDGARRRHRRRKGQGARTDARGIDSESSDDEEDGSDNQEHATCAHLRDIRVYRLASAIGFSELASYAIRRLYNRRALSSDEDPITLLETIYFPDDSGEAQPSQQLRTWSRAFLSRREDGSSMVSNVDKLQAHHRWRRRWNALLARSGQQGRSLIEDVRAACMQDAAGRQQRWGRQRQPQGMRYVGCHREGRSWYAHDLAAESSDSSSASTESSDGNNSTDAKRRWQENRFDYTTKQEQGFTPPPPPIQYDGYTRHFPGWWGGHHYLYPSPYPYPFSLSPSPAPLFQYYAATQPYESPHQQAQAQSQPTCKDSAPQTGGAASLVAAVADMPATMSSLSTGDAADRTCATAKGNKENERQGESPQNTTSDGTRRRKAQVKCNTACGRRTPPRRRRHSAVTQTLW